MATIIEHKGPECGQVFESFAWTQEQANQRIAELTEQGVPFSIRTVTI